jgi:hypothetical protein
MKGRKGLLLLPKSYSVTCGRRAKAAGWQQGEIKVLLVPFFLYLDLDGSQDQSFFFCLPISMFLMMLVML